MAARTLPPLSPPCPSSPFPLQKPRRAYPVELAQFHTADYVEFLSRITPDNAKKYAQQLNMYNISDDCPIFDGLFKCVGWWTLVNVKMSRAAKGLLIVIEV